MHHSGWLCRPSGHVDLVEVPPPVRVPPYPRNPLSANYTGDHRSEPVSANANRMTSGDELKQRKGLAGFARDLRLIRSGYRYPRALATLL